MSKIPHFLDSRFTNGGGVVGFCIGCALLPRNPIVQLKGTGALKKFSDLIGNRTCNLATCNIVPQPGVTVYCKISLQYGTLLEDGLVRPNISGF
jgi:hypothetical protein